MGSQVKVHLGCLCSCLICVHLSLLTNIPDVVFITLSLVHWSSYSVEPLEVMTLTGINAANVCWVPVCQAASLHSFPASYLTVRVPPLTAQSIQLFGEHKHGHQDCHSDGCDLASDTQSLWNFSIWDPLTFPPACQWSCFDFTFLNAVAPKFPTIMIKLHCQLHWIRNHLGDTYAGISVRTLSGSLTKERNTTLMWVALSSGLKVQTK